MCKAASTDSQKEVVLWEFFHNIGQQCFGISFWLFRNAGWGLPKPRTGPFPPPVEHAVRRGFQAPVGRLFLHIRAEKS